MLATIALSVDLFVFGTISVASIYVGEKVLRKDRKPASIGFHRGMCAVTHALAILNVAGVLSLIR